MTNGLKEVLNNKLIKFNPLKYCQVQINTANAQLTHTFVDFEHHWRRMEVHVEVVHQHTEPPDLLRHGSGHLNISRWAA